MKLEMVPDLIWLHIFWQDGVFFPKIVSFRFYEFQVLPEYL